MGEASNDDGIRPNQPTGMRHVKPNDTVEMNTYSSVSSTRCSCNPPNRNEPDCLCHDGHHRLGIAFHRQFSRVQDTPTG